MSSDEELDLDRLARDSLHFRKQMLELARDEELRIDAGAWADAIVFLQAGEVELECSAGECRSFAAGAVFCFVTPIRLLRNSGSDTARLIAISRRVSKRPTLSG
jgi:hypothetical protein